VTGSIVSPAMRDRVRGLATPVAVALGRLGLTPNALTVIGFAGMVGAGVAAAFEAWLLAGLLVLGFGTFDLFDGALARATGRVTRFGSFLDSVLDRTGENLLYAGIAVGAFIAGYGEAVIVTVLAMAFASGVTYARAKAESLGYHGEVGIAPRSERLVLVALTLVVTGILGGLGPRGNFPQGVVLDPDEILKGGSLAFIALMGLNAALCGVTVLQRILHVRSQAKEG
jgi:CDP-diacylglycerol---glycerol-3-phosphate 3-phosphatidyltransferase